jgi:hypothetical protein
MHGVPMELAWRALSEAPDDFAVFFPNPREAVFCRI